MQIRAGICCALVIAAAWIVAAPVAGHAQKSNHAARTKIVAYVPNWIDLPAFAPTMDWAHLTHVNIAFENPTDAGGSLSFHPADASVVALAHAHHVPVLVSIGGGGVSEDPTARARYFDLIAPAKRAGFVAKLAAYLSAHRFDGLDVDLEGDAINADYGPFVASLSRALKPKGKLLTSALSQGNGGSRVPNSTLALFDWVNIMAYDAAGPWNPNRPGQHSSLAFAQDSVKGWLQRGLPRSKAVLGVPFYGFGFGTAFNKDGYTYADILKIYPGAENSDQAGSTIWYNGLPTMRAKAQWVKAQQLGGVMIWALQQDAPGSKSLLSALASVLKP